MARGKLLDRVLTLIYPPRCPFCGELHPEGICMSCRQEIDGYKNQYHYRTDFCDGYDAPYVYRGLVRTGLIHLKFRKRTGQERWFAQQMARVVSKRHYDGIISVPPHRKGRKDERDISAILANQLAKELHLPYLTDAVSKKKNTPPQHEISREQRYVNLLDAFKADETKVKDKTILICDDIITTGSTVNELAKACRNAGAKRVYAVAFAVSLLHENRK